MISVIQVLRDTFYYFQNSVWTYVPIGFLRILPFRLSVKQIGPGCVFMRGVRVLSGSGVRLGSNCVINSDVLLDGRGGLEIGNNVDIAAEVMFLTASHDVRSVNHKFIIGGVSVGSNAWIATRAMILPGVKVGAGAVVAAGAVVTKDVPDYAIVAGVPAKQVGNRPRDLNYTLKYGKMWG